MTNVKATTVVEEMVKLKRKASEVASEVKKLMPVFVSACEAMTEQSVSVEGGFIYKRVRESWKYDKVIQALEKDLDAMKAAYEEQNEPDQTTVVWAVELR